MAVGVVALQLGVENAAIFGVFGDILGLLFADCLCDRNLAAVGTVVEIDVADFDAVGFLPFGVNIQRKARAIALMPVVTAGFILQLHALDSAAAATVFVFCFAHNERRAAAIRHPQPPTDRNQLCDHQITVSSAARLKPIFVEPQPARTLY